MKKKILSTFLVISLMFGAGQVYAATVLDSNIVSLISNSFISIKTHYVNDTKNDLSNLNDTYKEKISSYVKDKIDKSFNDIEKYKNSEITRANKELEKYYQDLKNDISNEIDSNAQEVKNSITAEVNNNIEFIKNDINSLLETTLNQNLKK